MRVDEPGECSPERVPEPEHCDGRDSQLSEPEERVEVSAITELMCLLLPLICGVQGSGVAASYTNASSVIGTPGKPPLNRFMTSSLNCSRSVIASCSSKLTPRPVTAGPAVACLPSILPTPESSSNNQPPTQLGSCPQATHSTSPWWGELLCTSQHADAGSCVSTVPSGLIFRS